MSVSQPDKQRRLLPRWQPSKSTIAAGELRPAENSSPAFTPEDEHFEWRKAEWERDRSIDVAAELVGSAIILGRTHEVEAAARLLAEPLSDVSPTLREMAQQSLGATAQGHKKGAYRDPDGWNVRSFTNRSVRLDSTCIEILAMPTHILILRGCIRFSGKTRRRSMPYSPPLLLSPKIGLCCEPVRVISCMWTNPRLHCGSSPEPCYVA